ncbi:S8 family serine peptidase [Modestobacter sp. VKM Ac-2983]|uniref:S8 family serine peptidase n=1 Tax=Modestobacter sp. VKM Ac-2983 TaxID=3004137 RepID=UPI0022AB6961|nr:S8 family serine peptidase [Modestobacter sp. VKM Ac-2983]MCZ2807586.1 S8 family serine peptidase [Modestobacter sp. VKM Ac-2983]
MSTPHHSGSGRVRSRGTRVLAGTMAAALGFGGAAVVDTFFSPALAVADEVADFGPAGDGLTRYVVSADGPITNGDLAALAALPGVAHAQPLFDGSALVATHDLPAAALAAAVPGSTVELSAPGAVAGAVSDPEWSRYGWNLANTGSNSYGQPGTAGADIDAPAGWLAGTGTGVVVAVLDTGLMTSHPDLQGALWRNPDEQPGSADVDGNGKPGDVNGWNFYTNSADVTNAGNDNSHGTSVTGVVAARAGNGEGSAGVAPNVTVMPLVIGSGGSVDLLLGAQAIKYAADNGADIVNASWGGPGGADILTEAIAYANSKGTVVVAAAGNDALDRDTSLFHPASLSAENLITVGNSNAVDGVSTSSAYGARSVQLFAPGHYVYTTWHDGSYRLVSGTSIAAPNVAGALALYRGVHDTDTAAQLKARLLADVDPVPAFVGKSVTGGRLSLTALGDSVADVSYSFAGMSGAAGVLTPTVGVSGSAPAGEYSLRLLLGMEHQGELMAVSGQSITADGVTYTTDDSGQVVVPLGQRASLGTVMLSPSLELTDGRYALVSQLQVDGAALTTPRAAPLLVGHVAAEAPESPTPAPNPTPAPAPTSPAPGTPAPSEEQPDGSGSDPAAPESPDSQTPDSQSPAPAPDTTQPVTDAPVDQSPGGDGSAPDAPDADTPGTETPGPEAPGTEAPGTDPEAPEQSEDAPTPGTAPLPTSPEPSTTPAPAPEDGTPAPDLGGEQEYPGTGPFGLTSISPTRVSADGGTRVTITGTAIPDGARVRVGDTGAAAVARNTGTELVFTTPALVPGTYDVHVFALDGTESVLSGGLTYVDTSGEPVPAPAPEDGVDPPDPALPPVEGAEPDDSPEQVVTTPGGQRLVSSPLFRSIPRSIWYLDCSVACTGLRL